MAKEATPKRAVAKTRPRVGGGLLRKIATKRGEVKTPPPSTRGGAPEKKGKMKPHQKRRRKNTAPVHKGGVRIHEATLYKGELKTPPPSTRGGGLPKKKEK